jgi:tetratricopeptide (TPR) repeat protein
VRWRIAVFLAIFGAVLPCDAATVLVLQFRNHSPYRDLNWVGEGVADILINELGAANEIVLNRSARAEAIRSLGLRQDADFTKASLLRLGQTVGADYLCFGEFEVTMPQGETQLKNGMIRVAAQFIDMRKMHDGPELSEAGKLSELSRLEEHLAYQSLKYLQPQSDLQFERFATPQKLVRLDAQESYVRGLLSTNREQKQKWFLQAAGLDSKFVGPAFELGKLQLEQKQYVTAMDWFRRVPSSDPNYAEARFKMGVAAYNAGQAATAADCFRDVLRSYPVSELYNNLGASELAAGHSNSADEFRRALESDPENPVYLFNLSLALYRTAAYDEAVKQLQKVLDKDSADSEAQVLLNHARRRETWPAGDQKIPAARLRSSFNETAFRQLKAMLTSKSGG